MCFFPAALNFVSTRPILTLFHTSAPLPLLRPSPPQTKQFASSDNAELFAEEVEREVATQKANERQRLAAVPGLIPQAEQQQTEMVDA